MKKKAFFSIFGSLVNFFVCNSIYAADSYRDMNLSLPIIAFGGEGTTKFEWNMASRGSIGFELNIQSENQFYTESEMKENNNDSLLVKGYEMAMIYSSYSNPKMMSGRYWALGVGYRTMDARWDHTPNEDRDLNGASLMENGKMLHSLRTQGASARARIGYRYVADSVPFSVGAYLGLRHFQNSFEDVTADGSTATTSEERESLSRRFMTMLEPGIELGMSF